MLGCCHARLLDHTRAVSEFKASLELDFENVSAMFNAALQYRHLRNEQAFILMVSTNVVLSSFFIALFKKIRIKPLILVGVLSGGCERACEATPAVCELLVAPPTDNLALFPATVITNFFSSVVARWLGDRSLHRDGPGD